MNPFPVTPLVQYVHRLILETFDVPEDRALECAAAMVSLAEGWGSPETAAGVNWPYRIRKDLGETRKFKWRSESDQASFEAIERQKYQAWDAFIRSPGHSY